MELTYRKEGKFLVFKRNGETLNYNLSDGTMLRIKNGKEDYMKSVHSFFKNIKPVSLLKLLEDDFKEVLGFIYYIHSNRFNNAGTLLHKLQQCMKFESYIKIGMRPLLDKIYNYSRYYYSNNGLLFDIPELKCLNSRFIKILNNESSYISLDTFSTGDLISVIKSNENIEFFLSIYNLIEKHKLLPQDKIFLYTLKNIKKIRTCVDKYNCDLSSLLNYIIFRIENMENYGYNSWDDYIDYLNMQTKIVTLAKELNPNLIISSKVEKYPKYLKTNHDIVVKIYNNYKKEYPEDVFKAMVNYKLEQDNLPNKLVAVMPKSTNEMKEEGIYQSHCCGSYIDSIINGDRQVAFLRTVENPTIPLITLDIKDGMIQQYEGKNRRAPNEKEWEAIEKYAKIKKLRLK
jgi:hypothetical protein